MSRGFHSQRGVLVPSGVGARRLRPWIHVHGPFRGARVRAIDGADVTLDVQIEAHLRGTRTVPASIFPDAMAPITVGMPVVVRVEADDDYAVREVRPGRWAGEGPGTDEAGAVARGDWHVAALGTAEGWTEFFD